MKTEFSEEEMFNHLKSIWPFVKGITKKSIEVDEFSLLSVNYDNVKKELTVVFDKDTKKD